MKEKTTLLITIVCTLLMLTSFNNKQLKEQNIINKTDITNNDSLDSNFIEYEIMPSFVGGDVKLLEFIDKNINKEFVGNQNLISGRCLVEFTIDSIGKCGNFKVVRSYNPEIDSEFIRVLKLMPNWNPGKIYIKNTWKKVAIKYTIPLRIPYKQKN